MLASVFGDSVAATLEDISPDLLHLEQYMDFVRNRLFRQTLLCHAARRPKRALTPGFMSGLLMSSRATSEAVPDLSSQAPAAFHNGPQRAEVTLPASKAAFTLLAEAWPRAVAVDELCALALARAAPFLGETSQRDAKGTMLGDLLRAVLYGMVRLHTGQVSCTNRPSDTPRAHPLVAYQASLGPVVVNAHHEMVRLEPLGLEVVKLADGTRSRDQILEALVGQHAAGRLVIEDKGERITSPERARTVLTDRLAEALASLMRSGVLVD